MASTFLVTAVMDVALGLEFGYVAPLSLLTPKHPKTVLLLRSLFYAPF